jgi:uncharacterized protein YjbJ (UPF0337 family)
MNWDQVQGNWEQFKGKVREKWGRLTDDDIGVVHGKRDQLVGKIQERYGFVKERAEDEVNGFLKSCNDKNARREACDGVSKANLN